MPGRRACIPVVLTVALALPAALAAQTRTFDRTLDLDAGASLTLVSEKGSVTLTSWDQERVEIHARIEAPDDVGADYAREAVDATEIRVTGDRRALRIAPDYDKVPYERRWFSGGSRTVPPIHFEIKAPRRLDLRLDLDRSETRLAGFEGRIEIVSDRGDIDASDLTGSLTLEVDRGDRVRLTGLSGSFDIEADRSDVRVAVSRLEDDSRVEIDRGGVEVSVAASQGLDLRADIERRADFDSEFPVTMRGPIGDRFEGSINGGGPRLTIYSDRAPVRLRKAGQ